MVQALVARVRVRVHGRAYVWVCVRTCVRVRVRVRVRVCACVYVFNPFRARRIDSHHHRRVTLEARTGCPAPAPPCHGGFPLRSHRAPRW